MKIVLSINRTEYLENDAENKIEDIAYDHESQKITFSIQGKTYAVPVENVLGTYVELDENNEVAGIISKVGYCNNS